MNYRLRPFQENGQCYPLDTSDGLRRVAVRSAGASVAGQSANFLVGIGSVVILARLLTPADFGVVTMVTTVSLLFRSFGLNGFTELIIQRDEITDSLASNIFWINLGIGLLLTAAFAGAGSLLASFYHDPLVSNVAVWMSLTIGIGSLGYIHQGLLQRAMHFRSLAVIQFCGQSLLVIVSIVLALEGWNYWALVWGSITQTASVTAGCWLVCRWIPGKPGRVEGTGVSLSFAMHVYSHFVSTYLKSNTDNLLVGWRYGAQWLGFYKKAYDMFVLPTTQLQTPLGAVVVATLSRIRHDRDQFQRCFLRLISVLALIGMGVGADFALLGQDLFRVLLGPGWDKAGNVFALFGPGIGIMLLYNTHGWIHLSVGRPERWLRWGLLEASITIALFFVGLHWGPSGVALAWTVSFFLLVVPAFWYAGEPIGLGIRPVLSAIWKFFVASAGAGAITFLLLKKMTYSASSFGMFQAIVNITVVSAVLLVLYFAGVIVLHRGLNPFRETLSLLNDLLPNTEIVRRTYAANAAEASGWSTSELPQAEFAMAGGDPKTGKQFLRSGERQHRNP